MVSNTFSSLNEYSFYIARAFESRSEPVDHVKMSPILLSPGERIVTVFGGGPVALRKCRHFDGFRIRVISLEVIPELRELAEEVIIGEITPESIPEWIEGSDIVVAATSDHGLNDSIRDISMSKGIMTNSAHGGGDVLIPSILHRAGWTVCVSSEGRVPAFSPYVIDRIDELLDPSYDRMLALLYGLRGDIRGRIATQPERAAFLAGVLADEDIWRLLEEEKSEEARQLALERGGLA